MPIEPTPTARTAGLDASGFGYDAAVLERFPTIRAGVVRVTGLSDGPSPEGLLDAYGREQATRAEQLQSVPIAELPSIAAWRRVFSAFGAKPTQHRNAAEALLRRLHKHGDVPSISALVDIGNLVSIRHAMPVAVFDSSKVAGSITVRFAHGIEPFADLGSSESVHPEPGEVVFVDEDGVVGARRWCWRQSAQSATGPQTTEALYVVEGHHDTAENDVRQARDLIVELLAAHQPGAEASGDVLNLTAPAEIARD